MPAKKRDYKKEYRDYHGKPEQRKRRGERVQARRDAVKAGRVKKGDKSKEVHHPNAKRTGSLGKKTKVISKKANRKIQPKRKKK